MNRTLTRAALCALMLITYQITIATILVQGNSAGSITENTATFTTAVIAKLFDHPTATLIVSTAISGTTPNDYSIAAAAGTLGADIPVFVPIAPAFAESTNINMLSLATSYGNTNPNIAFVMASAPTNLNIVSLNGGTSFQGTTPLNDANNATTINAAGIPTTAIISLTANQSFIFAAVTPNDLYDPNPAFGAVDSGIASVSITPGTLVLTQVPAISGDGGIKAAPFDGTISAVAFQGSVNINPNNLPNSLQPTYPAMIWDDQLQRFYIGYDLETINALGYSASGGLSVTAGYVSSPSGTLGFLPMAPGSAFMPEQQNYIIGVALDEICRYPICTPGDYYPEDCDPTDQVEPYCDGQLPPTCACPGDDLSVFRLAVLHASTGPSYLIVNGGNGTHATTGNQIYALPLVDNASNQSTNGTFANKNSPLTNGKFTVPAMNLGDLTINTDPAAIVGTGPFPIPGNIPLADLVVVGDTVYASSEEPTSSLTETGIFYSQAMFDETGKIIRWTPWTKRAFPYNGFPNNSPQTSFLSVDASSGEIWAVDGLTKTSVTVTAWDKGSTPSSLATQLNNNLSTTNNCSGPRYSGCFSVLDLDQSTRGFLGNTCSRYALFGGINKVIFAQVSESLDLYCSSGNSMSDSVLSPQQVTIDYTQPQNLLVTTLLDCGAITTLEYARQLSGSNYFFAGTQNGLYVFADPQGNGFNVSTFGNLNAAPFSTGRWYKAPNITGSVIDIKTTGNTLYVITVSSTPGAPLQGTVYRIPFQSTVNTMFATGNINTLAQTMTAPGLSTALRFTGMQIISTTSTGTQEQLVLSTNNGLFQSSATGGIQGAANQTTANWQPVNKSSNSFYLGIGGMNTSIPVASPSTVWPFNLQDPTGLRLFSRGSIYQLNGSDTAPFNFVPPFFNSSNSANPNFTTLDPITYFWSDGARRFFVINPNKRGCTVPSSNRLMVLPFDTTDWNIATPTQDLDIDPLLPTVESFYWIQDIGAAGIVMAGTDQGVIALE